METKTKKIAHKTMATAAGKKKISKIGQWLDANPRGIITVIDRRAVNK